MSTVSSELGSLPIKNLKSGPADPKLSEITLVSSSSDMSDGMTERNSNSNSNSNNSDSNNNNNNNNNNNTASHPQNIITSLPMLVTTPKGAGSFTTVGDNVNSSSNNNNENSNINDYGSNFFTNVFNGLAAKITNGSSNDATTNEEPSSKDNVPNFASEQENTAFHRLFKHLPESDKLVTYIDCELIEDGAVACSGRLFVSQHHLSYNANYRNWFAQFQVPLTDVKSVELTREDSNKVIPESLNVGTCDGTTTFSSHSVGNSLNKTYQLINRLMKDRNSTKEEDNDNNDTMMYGTGKQLGQNLGHAGHSMGSDRVVDNPVGLLPQAVIRTINVKELTEKFEVGGDATSNTAKGFESMVPVIPGSITVGHLSSSTNSPVGVSRATHLITQILDANSKANSVTKDIENAIRSIDDSSSNFSRLTSSNSISSNSSAFTAASDSNSDSSKFLKVTTTSSMSSQIPIFKFKSDSKYKFNGLFYRPTFAPDLTTDFKTEKKEYQLLEKTFNCPPGILFEILFSDTVTDFTQDYIKVQDGSDITSISKFRDNARSYSYIKHLHLPVGPKQTSCNLTETIVHRDEMDYIEVIVSVMTPDVPSGRSFYTKSRYLIRWDPEGDPEGGRPQRCILRLSYWIEWVARSWIEKMIESNCRSVMIETVGQFEDLADRYVEENVEAGFVDDTKEGGGGGAALSADGGGRKAIEPGMKVAELGTTSEKFMAKDTGRKEGFVSEEVAKFNKLLNGRPMAPTLQLRGSFAIVLLLGLLLINTVLLAGVLFHLIKLKDTFTKYFERNAVEVLLEESRRIIPMDRIPDGIE